MEQTEPKIYKDKVLGEFMLDERIDQYVTKIEWPRGYITLSVENCEGKELDGVFATANKIVKAKNEWDKKIKEFAAVELMELKNDSWLDEDEAEITADQFVEKIKIETIDISLDNEFEFYLDDGDIFWGHTIIVSGNLEEGPQEAQIAG